MVGDSRRLATVTLASVLSLLAACKANNASRDVAVDLLEIPLSESQRLDPESFNRQLEAAHSDGQQWTDDPVQILGRFINSGLGRDAIWSISGTGERPSRYRMTVVVDGIPDDSVRGRRYDATLERASNGAWQIRDASLRWRCWRGTSNSFSAAPCS